MFGRTSMLILASALALVPGLALASPDAGESAQRAERGPAYQFTPTLPPPTTTTTSPPDPTILPIWTDTGRRVVYSIGSMRVWAVEADNTVARTYRVSGKRSMPVPGVYSVFSRSLYTVNIDNPDVSMRFMIRFTKGPAGDNIGFHEIPIKCDSAGCRPLQTESQLGQALSGGCIRQATADAEWLWGWAGVGTKVVVVA